jgi:hypothetical protein
MSYWDRLGAAKESLLAELVRRGVEPGYLDLGGPGQKPSRMRRLFPQEAAWNSIRP